MSLHAHTDQLATWPESCLPPSDYIEPRTNANESVDRPRSRPSPSLRSCCPPASHRAVPPRVSHNVRIRPGFFEIRSLIRELWLLMGAVKNTSSPDRKAGARGDSISLERCPIGGVSRRHPGTRGSLYLSQVCASQTHKDIMGHRSCKSRSRGYAFPGS